MPVSSIFSLNRLTLRYRLLIRWHCQFVTMLRLAPWDPAPLSLQHCLLPVGMLQTPMKRRYLVWVLALLLLKQCLFRTWIGVF